MLKNYFILTKNIRLREKSIFSGNKKEEKTINYISENFKLDPYCSFISGS